MARHFVKRTQWLGFCLMLTLIAACSQQEQESSTADSANELLTSGIVEGTLPDGSAYRIDIPESWNGTVLIDLDYLSRVNSNDSVRADLLSRGFGMAGTTRAVAGWAIHQSVDNFVQIKAITSENFGEPEWTLAYGRSMGGHTSATAVNMYPEVFSGAISLCSSPVGGIALWNGKLDGLYTAKTLLAPDSDLPIIDIAEDFRQTAQPAWQAMLAEAQATPEGRARIALAAVLAHLPDWSEQSKPRPARDDFQARQEGLYDSLSGGRLPLVGQALSSRSQINDLAGGNISWNVGYDYRTALNALDEKALVEALYRDAGLDLNADLDRLNANATIRADLDAVAYMAPQVFTGNLQVPMITLHNIGDQISPVDGTATLAEAVASAGRDSMLRQVYTEAAGHCNFTTAESVATVLTMHTRLETGNWLDTSASAMSQRADELSLGESHFIDYQAQPTGRTFWKEQLPDAAELIPH